MIERILSVSFRGRNGHFAGSVVVLQHLAIVDDLKIPVFFPGQHDIPEPLSQQQNKRFWFSAMPSQQAE